jgi:hypothetical protein
MLAHKGFFYFRRSAINFALRKISIFSVSGLL